jgi:FkbM family methyltransferase
MLKASDELRLCADAHEQEVIVKDSYRIKSLLERDPNIEYVVDIGANIGAFSTHIHRLIPNARIISCEPEPSMMAFIKQNTDNKLIYVEKAVIGDPTIKEVVFNICKWQGNHHVDGRFNWDAYAPVGSEKIKSITVGATTLQQIVDENKFPRIDLLKVDTEGSEPEILQGIKPWLKNIKHILGEWHSQKDLTAVKETLKDTHNVTIEDGFFVEPATGLKANGNFYAELK